MRKNKFMRAASGLLVAVLLTTCVISGTFAKYTTSATGNDSARVATWGFDENNASITFTNLFTNVYDNVKGEDSDVIAPGTTSSATFKFDYTGAKKAPEVAYTFKIDTSECTCDNDIKNNKNIVWSLDGTEYATDESSTSWEKLIAAIKKLSGNDSGTKQYKAGELPDAFKDNTQNSTHTVAWQWKFDKATDQTAEDNDVMDTKMGNKAALDKVTLKITVTATQVD